MTHFTRFSTYRPAFLLALAALAAASTSRADSLVVWGDNTWGQLGDGTSGFGNQRSSPFALPNLASGITAIAGGGLHSLAVQNGAVYAWGDNAVGELGDGTTTNRASPVAVPSLSSGVTAIAAGWYYSLAVKNGAVYAWGGDFYQVGGVNPVALPSLASGVTAIAAGNYHSLAVQNGAVYAWGGNGVGQLGNGTTTGSASSPIAITNLASGVTAIAAGGYHSLAVKNGAVYAWGYNAVGEIGDGTITQSTSSPVAIASLAGGVTAIAAGGFHSLAVQNGLVYAWGYNGVGQLGDGTTTNRSSPEQVLGLSNIVEVAATDLSSYALASDGSLWVWGYNNYGQLGLGDSADRFTPTHLLAPAGYVYTSIDGDANGAHADANGGHILATLAPIAVPEPASLTLLALGSLTLLSRRRK